MFLTRQEMGSPSPWETVNLWRAGKAGDTISVVIISGLPFYVFFYFLKTCGRAHACARSRTMIQLAKLWFFFDMCKFGFEK